jgi:hypothetical protein
MSPQLRCHGVIWHRPGLSPLKRRGSLLPRFSENQVFVATKVFLDRGLIPLVCTLFYLAFAHSFIVSHCFARELLQPAT